MKKVCSLFLVVLMVALLLSSFCVNASAATTLRQDCIGYNYMGSNAGKSTYQIRYYNIAANKKVTINGFWNTEKLKNQTFAKLKLIDYLRFDVQIIDKNSGSVVNYWNSLKVGDKFKVYSAVPKIQTGNYQVRITSYLYNYKTYVNSNLAGVATCLKYDLKY